MVYGGAVPDVWSMEYGVWIASLLTGTIRSKRWRRPSRLNKGSCEWFEGVSCDSGQLESESGEGAEADIVVLWCDVSDSRIPGGMGGLDGMQMGNYGGTEG